jgi:hypothetical protein
MPSTITLKEENSLVDSKKVPRVKLNSINFKPLKKNKPSENSTNDLVSYLKYINNFLIYN